MRSFIGFANYYRRFIKSFAHIAAPLTALTQKAKVFTWTAQCEESFQLLKSKLIEAPILAYPSSDPNARYILDTDASNVGIGGVLSQIQDGVEHVIAYASQTLSRSQRNYCTTYRELLAVVAFVKQYRHYLLGQEFTIRTDHSSLRWLMNFKDPEGLISRWLLSLQPFDYVIIHRKGTSHGNADGLSRKEPVARRRRCARPECSECPTGTVSNVSVVTATQSSHDEALNTQNGNGNTHHEGTSSTNLSIEIAEAVDTDTDDDSQMGDEPATNPHLSNNNQVTSNWIDNWSKTELSEMQQNDFAISRVITLRQDRDKCPDREELLRESSDVRDLCGQWSKLEIIDGLLYRRWMPKCLNTERYQFVAPQLLRAKLLTEFHDSRTAGHLGVKRTLMKLRQRVFWPKCKSDVQRWCLECRVCAQIKPGPGFRAKLHQIPVRNKLDRIAIDILGELPETDNGNKYIVVVSDYFTKWTHAMAIPDQVAQTVADKIMIEFIAVFGVPTQLHTDQGRNFESHLFKQVCDLLGIHKTRTTPFHAQSDGQVERWNRTIQQMLKGFVNQNRDDWDEHLPYLCMAYRATPHECTGCTPNLMMFGQENNMALDVMMGPPPKAKPDVACPVEYVEWLRQTLNGVYQYASDQLDRNAKRQKNYYDKKSKPTQYKVGSYVWRWYPPAARGKLSKGWTGPFRIMEIPTSIHCVIQKSADQPQHRVHIDTLKPYNGPIPVEWEGYQTIQIPNIPINEDDSSSEDSSDDTRANVMNGDVEQDIPNFDNDGMVDIRTNANITEEFNNDEANDFTGDPVDDDSDSVHNIPPPVETPKGRGCRIKRPAKIFTPQ